MRGCGSERYLIREEGKDVVEGAEVECGEGEGGGGRHLQADGKLSNFREGTDREDCVGKRMGQGETVKADLD